MSSISVAAAQWMRMQQDPFAISNMDILGLVFLGAFIILFTLMAYRFLAVKKKERIEALTRISEEYAKEAQAQEALQAKEASEAIQVPVATEDPSEATLERLTGFADDRDQTVPSPEDGATAEVKYEQEQASKAYDQLAESIDDGGETIGIDAEIPAVSEVEIKPEVAQAPPKKSLFQALSKTRDGFIGKVANVFSGKGAISEDTFEELEAALFSADIGAQTADRLFDAVRTRMKNTELGSTEKVTEGLKEEIVTILSGVENTPLALNGDAPAVMMVVGVNGAGKTTSIGKLTHQLQSDGKKVVLGAGDTFRAAAVEQLEIWGERNGAPVVKGKEGADPSSVLFDAVNKAKEEKADIVLCDTAGRLHTKTNLMEELKKVHRVLGKAQGGAPHEVLLVLDATTGQNAIQQAKQFGEAVPLTGIVLTKLDGTAKGGVVIGIAEELKVPVKYIGVGETIDDLRPFDAQEFVSALFDEAPLS
jgi:fused signal recognition particle receptor